MANLNRQHIPPIVIILALIGAGLLGLGTLMALPTLVAGLNNIAAPFMPSQTCTVGIVGTAASITYTGPQAQAACDQAVQDNPQSVYLMTVTPTGNVMCEGNRAGYHLVVRDS